MARLVRQRKPFHAAFVVCLVLATLSGCSRTMDLPAAIPPVQVPSFPGNNDPELLIDAANLMSRISAAENPPVILDASELRTYRSGHIPGAVHAWWQDTMDPNGPAYGTVLKPDQNQPDPQQLRRFFIEDLGVTRNQDVVVYDDARGQWASRVVWTLRFLGYPRAAVLDGGLPAWRGAGGSIETAGVDPTPIEQPPIDPQPGWYLVTGELLELLNDPAVLLLDVRTAQERADDVGGTVEPGSIPGSVQLPWTSMIADDAGHLLPPQGLQSLFESHGVTPDRTVVLYARFGVETAHTWLALKLLGYPAVMIYDGGWADWAQHPDTPKVPLTESTP